MLFFKYRYFILLIERQQVIVDQLNQTNGKNALFCLNLITPANWCRWHCSLSGKSQLNSTLVGSRKTVLLIIRVVKRVTEVKYFYRSFLITFSMAQWSKGHLISVLFEGHRVESFLGVITFDRIKNVRAQHFSLPIKMFVKILSVLDSNPQPCFKLNRVLESVNKSYLLKQSEF